MAGEKLIITAAEMAERALASTTAGAKMLDEVAGAAPGVAKALGIESSAAKVAAPIVEKEAGALAQFNRAPRILSEAEQDANLERAMANMADGTIGMPPTELTNQGLGARVWQFGTAGGYLPRERELAEITGKWSPELAASRDWLARNPEALTKLGPLPEGKLLTPAQLVHQGESTQFAAGPMGTALRTDNVATCAAVYCTDGTTQFLGHADNMIHHRALTEALETAGINLDKAEVTIMPGPIKSPTLESILPSFLNNENAMARLKIIPFRGPGNGSVVAQDGKLFIPTK